MPTKFNERYLHWGNNDFDAPLLGLWKNFHSSPKRRWLLVSFQVIYLKKLLNILKAVVNHWFTHSAASERVLDCLLQVLEALNQIFVDTNESEVKLQKFTDGSQSGVFHLLDGRDTVLKSS